MNSKTAHKVSIGQDERTQAHIVNLVVKSLYQNPLRSCFVETISNAIDAAEETGRYPIKIQIPTEFDRTYIIEDSGPGMSPDLIANVYSQLGVSTKRDNENAIGTYGIGAMTIQNISDETVIVTTYGGIKYTYQYKTEDVSGVESNTLNLISQEPTSEDSGTKIICPVSQEINIRNADTYIMSRLLFTDIEKYEVSYPKTDNSYYNEYYSNAKKEWLHRLSEIHEKKETLSEEIEFINFLPSVEKFGPIFAIDELQIPERILIDCGGVPYGSDHIFMDPCLNNLVDHFFDIRESTKAWTVEDSDAQLCHAISKHLKNMLWQDSSPELSRVGQVDKTKKDPTVYAVLKADMSGIMLDTSRENIKLDPITIKTITDLLIKLVILIKDRIKIYSEKTPHVHRKVHAHIYRLSSCLSDYERNRIFFEHEGVRYTCGGQSINESPVYEKNGSEYTEIGKIKTCAINAKVWGSLNFAQIHHVLIVSREVADAKYVVNDPTFYTLLKEVERRNLVVAGSLNYGPKGLIKTLTKRLLPKLPGIVVEKTKHLSVLEIDGFIQASVAVDALISACPALDRKDFQPFDMRYTKRKAEKKVVKKAKALDLKGARRTIENSIANVRGLDILLVAAGKKNQDIELLAPAVLTYNLDPSEEKFHKFFDKALILNGRSGTSDKAAGTTNFRKILSSANRLDLEIPHKIIRVTDHLFTNIGLIKDELNLFDFDNLLEQMKNTYDDRFIETLQLSTLWKETNGITDNCLIFKNLGFLEVALAVWEHSGIKKLDCISYADLIFKTLDLIKWVTQGYKKDPLYSWYRSQQGFVDEVKWLESIDNGSSLDAIDFKAIVKSEALEKKVKDLRPHKTENKTLQMLLTLICLHPMSRDVINKDGKFKKFNEKCREIFPFLLDLLSQPKLESYYADSNWKFDRPSGLSDKIPIPLWQSSYKLLYRDFIDDLKVQGEIGLVGRCINEIHRQDPLTERVIPEEFTYSAKLDFMQIIQTARLMDLIADG